MTLRRLTIVLSAFLLLAAILTLLWARHTRRQPVDPPPFTVQLPVVPEDNAYDTFLRAADLYVDHDALLRTRAGEPVSAEQREALRENEPALTELRRGLGSPCVIPQFARGEDLPFSQWSTFRDMADLLVLESRIATEEERSGEALGSLCDGLRFGGKLETGAPEIGWLNSVTIQLIALEPMNELVGSDRLEEQQLLEAIQCVTEVDAASPPIAQTIETEHRMNVRDLQELGAGRLIVGSDLVWTPDEAVLPVPYDHKWAIKLHAHVRNRALEAARWSYAELRANGVEAPPVRLAWAEASHARTRAHLYGATISQRFKLRSQRRGTRLLAAVELYRLRHGELPESLDMLATLDLPGVDLTITDPLTDEPYIYRVRNGDYSLYSIGPDLIDDGGLPRAVPTSQPHDTVFHESADDTTERPTP